MSDLSGDFNDNGDLFNKDVPESPSYREQHYTAEFHSAPETTSFSETGDPFAIIKPKATLTTSRGMNEALKYSTQVATVIKAVAVITVAAVVVGVPILEDLSPSIGVEFIEYGADETYVFYYIEIMDFTEDMDLTVSVHNDFVNRSVPIKEGYASGYESGLQPNMEYKISVMQGSRVIAERSVWTKSSSDSPGKPEFTMQFCDYSESDGRFEFLFDANNDDWSGFSAIVTCGEDVVGSLSITDTQGTHSLTLNLSGIDNINKHTFTFCLYCDEDVGGTTYERLLYSKDFTAYKMPHLTVSGTPTFDRGAGSLTVNFTLTDPKEAVRASEGIKAVVECPALSGGATTSSVYAMCDRTDKSITVDVSPLIGYDSTVKIYCLDADSNESLLYTSDVALYLGDSGFTLTGIHLEGSDLYTLYLDMDYLDDDNVLSDFSADVTINGTTITDLTINGIGSDPHITLPDKIESTGYDVTATVHYSKHPANSSTPVAQPDAVFTSLHIMPRLTVSGTPTFDRSAGTLTVNFSLDDPKDAVRTTEGIKAVVECPALNGGATASSVYALCDKTATSITVNVSTFIGYDATVTIYGLDTGSNEIPMYTHDVALYLGDSEFTVTGIHLDGTDRNTLYLDMSYLDDDNVLSGFSADVTVNSTTTTDLTIAGMWSDPHIILPNEISSVDDEVTVTIHYSKHSATSSTPVAQPDAVFSGLHVPYVEPRFDSAWDYDRFGARSYDPEMTMQTFKFLVDDPDSNWNISGYSATAYYVTADDYDSRSDPSTHHDFSEDADFEYRFMEESDGVFCKMQVPASVPAYNVVIYATISYTDSSTSVTTVVVSDLEIPTVFFETVPSGLTPDNTHTYDNDTEPFVINVTRLIGISNTDVCKADFSYYALNISGEEFSSAQPIGSNTFSGTGNVTLVLSDLAPGAEGHAYLTISIYDSDKGVYRYLFPESYIPGVLVMSG